MKKLVLIAVAFAALFACKGPAKSVETKLAEYSKWNDDFMTSFRSRITELQDNPEAAREFADSAEQVFMDYNKAALLENLDNAVGVEALKKVYYELEDNELLDIMDKFTAEVHGQDSSFVESVKVSVQSRVNTAEGLMFTDFEVNGVKFSDFIGKGKYVLVDFWASWCGPCRREIPNIRSVYEKFHGDKFDILSVAVWDKKEETIKAAKEENIVWNQIIDAQRIPTDIYGIQGIPQIMLFGPDGTILRRNLRGDAIAEAVAQALNQ